jgi:sugar/nucleoside kinase (ribokinase family)
MSVLIVGSTALDSIKTPRAENPRLLGGSASHASVAASFFAPVKLVGVVGEDFPKKYIQLYRRHEIDLEGLQILPGKTFHWSGEYEVNMNNRRTLATELGVFETFNPILPEAYQNASFVLLANIAPSLQSHVLNQMQRPRFVVADTMDLWLNIALPDLLKLLKRVDGFVLNDSEARQLTQGDNLMTALKKIHKLGQIRHHQKRRARGAPLVTKRFVCLARLSAASRGGPDRRGRFVRGRDDGLFVHRSRLGG